jgi:uncharacterized protein (DUF1697 family)
MAQPRTYAALLRGINVGGRSKVPMSELAELFRSLGHQDVVTYIQSGNVVFSSPRTPGTIVHGLEDGIAGRFGLPVRVMLRDRRELAQVEDANPFAGAAGEPSRLHVVYLERAPSRGATAKLDPDRSPGDAFAVSGREVYLHLPNGAGRTKLTLDYLERTLGLAGTQRNWSTLVRLIELTTPGSAC